MPQVVGKDTTVLKRVTCRACGSINEYAPNEVRVLREYKDISQSYCKESGFNCAGCGKEIIVRYV